MDEINRAIEDDFSERAPDFRPTFMRLKDAMMKDETKKIERRARLEKQQRTRQAFLIHSASSMVGQEGYGTPPHRPAHLPDPRYSGSSTESRTETAPNMLILTFLQDCSLCLGVSVRQLGWPQTQNLVRVAFT